MAVPAKLDKPTQTVLNLVADSGLKLDADAGAVMNDSYENARRARRRYKQICLGIDVALRDGRLADAQRLNDEARMLYRHLYGPASRASQKPDPLNRAR